MQSKLTSVISVLLILSLCLAFTACSGGEKSSADASATVNEAPTEEASRVPVTVVKEAKPIALHERGTEDDIEIYFKASNTTDNINFFNIKMSADEGKEYVYVDLEITNNGSKEQSFETGDMKAKTDNGTASFQMGFGGSSVSPGSSLSPGYYFEVVKDWKEFELDLVSSEGTAFPLVINREKN